jgi:monomeric isocitrate dehydrogenase
MITIITPMGGASLYEMSAEFSYPKLLNEVNKENTLRVFTRYLSLIGRRSTATFLATG